MLCAFALFLCGHHSAHRWNSWNFFHRVKSHGVTGKPSLYSPVLRFYLLLDETGKKLTLSSLHTRPRARNGFWRRIRCWSFDSTHSVETKEKHEKYNSNPIMTIISFEKCTNANTNMNIIIIFAVKEIIFFLEWNVASVYREKLNEIRHR